MLLSLIITLFKPHDKPVMGGLFGNIFGKYFKIFADIWGQIKPCFREAYFYPIMWTNGSFDLGMNQKGYTAAGSKTLIIY